MQTQYVAQFESTFLAFTSFHLSTPYDYAVQINIILNALARAVFSLSFSSNPST